MQWQILFGMLVVFVGSFGCSETKEETRPALPGTLLEAALESREDGKLVMRIDESRTRSVDPMNAPLLIDFKTELPAMRAYHSKRHHEQGMVGFTLEECLPQVDEMEQRFFYTLLPDGRRLKKCATKVGDTLTLGTIISLRARGTCVRSCALPTESVQAIRSRIERGSVQLLRDEPLPGVAK